MLNGEITMGKTNKTNCTFTQRQLLTAKYTVVDVSGTAVGACRLAPVVPSSRGYVCVCVCVCMC